MNLVEDEIQTDLSDRVQSSPVQKEQPAVTVSRVQPADTATVRMQRSVDLMAASMVKLTNTVTTISDKVNSMQEDRANSSWRELTNYVAGKVVGPINNNNHVQLESDAIASRGMAGLLPQPTDKLPCKHCDPNTH